MTGTDFVALVLVSMGWLFFLAGLAVNYSARRRSRPGIPLLPGLIGSVTVFFSLPPLIQRGMDAPSPLLCSAAWTCRGRVYGSCCRSCWIPAACQGYCAACANRMRGSHGA